jgi:hypothetical protein
MLTKCNSLFCIVVVVVFLFAYFICSEMIKRFLATPPLAEAAAAAAVFSLYSTEFKFIVFVFVSFFLMIE